MCKTRTDRPDSGTAALPRCPAAPLPRCRQSRSRKSMNTPALGWSSHPCRPGYAMPGTGTDSASSPPGGIRHPRLAPRHELGTSEPRAAARPAADLSQRDPIEAGASTGGFGLGRRRAAVSCRSGEIRGAQQARPGARDTHTCRCRRSSAPRASLQPRLLAHSRGFELPILRNKVYP